MTYQGVDKLNSSLSDELRPTFFRQIIKLLQVLNKNSNYKMIVDHKIRTCAIKNNIILICCVL